MKVSEAEIEFLKSFHLVMAKKFSGTGSQLLFIKCMIVIGNEYDFVFFKV